MLGLAVVAELGVGRQGLGPEPGGGGEELVIVGHLGEGETLGRIARFVPRVQNGGQSLGQVDVLLELADHSRHVPGDRRAGRSQFRGTAERNHRLVELALVRQGVAEVVVGSGVVGLEPDRLAVRGDGLVQLALVPGRCRGSVGTASSGWSRIASRKAAIALVVVLESQRMAPRLM